MTKAISKSDAPLPFASRHIGPSPTEVSAMLETVGAASLDELIAQTLPQDIRERERLVLQPALSESAALEKAREVASRNVSMTSLIGQGYYGTILPPVIQRNILENPAWYTAYTPYQPEISQGRLEALLNFQTLVANLTGLEIANASLLDEATAAAEAIAMAQRISETGRTLFFADRDCHPQTLAVLRTRAEAFGWRVQVGDPMRDLDASQVFGAIFQYPGTFGDIPDLREPIAQLKASSAIAVVAADPLALAILKPPGELGADIAVGSMQRFGVPMGYGGPHAAYIATRDIHKRALPGRLVGVSIDSRGNRGYRLALQTREQHIRREKATSNICTAQVLLAVIASMYAVYHGPDGLAAIARRINKTAGVLRAGLVALGWTVRTSVFFDTITVEAGERRQEILERARNMGINLRDIASAGRASHIGISVDETTTAAIVEKVWCAFGDTPAAAARRSIALADTFLAIPDEHARKSDFLDHPVFHQYRSETELLRYMRRLADRDLALDRSMIPLGSCTMKLNATAEMMPLTWPEFANLHPFAPASQAQGYATVIDELGAMLLAVTGYDEISFQPNSGAQGEYAGLLAIRAYHRSRGEDQRTLCLIPASAHGTNPASAHMAGMEVEIVRCNDNGNVDVDDLRRKASAHADRLAAIMITYPSTHGVFEEEIRAICDIVHAHGGQVYLDGANLNAQVGLARPADYGADVGHLNLHKTFCIPHGGGGPGMGPIGVKAHLAPFLPGHPEQPDGPAVVGAVSAAPYGSASILVIPWLYCLMMGGAGLTAATEIAILNANYIARRLESHYPLLYKGRFGRVAHECIIDLRPLKNAAAISVDDVAKRLIDYGFHAPTMSFPVPGTLMIEPTESESKMELDRFCDAMIAIRGEIRAIEQGQTPRESNLLRNAPHTALDLAEEHWQRPYSRAQACFPEGVLPGQKYWPPVNRIDNAYGDRNLMCSCPPPAAYRTAAE
ncbi:MAG TPA: aminomethyl-transferring glycine dehydrogenase [Xanthobacteraceae bacterium]|nr:aminomethyl-transferring glycine dehydrogenase [Xanthobacteraceae bacterium]